MCANPAKPAPFEEFQADFSPRITSGKELEAARDIARRLQEAGFIAYLVGGCVRDALLGRPVGDYDVATDAPPSKVEELFPKTFPVGAAFGVIIVRHKGQTCEVATFRSEAGYADRRRPSEVKFSTPDEDVKRRDFTINGLFYDPVREVGIDYVGGVADLEAKRLRTIGDAGARFDEDALRLLRAVRFAASLGLEIEAETRAALVERVALLREISVERIEEELSKGLKLRPGAYLAMLNELGLLGEALPAVAALDGLDVGGLDVGGRPILEATSQRLDYLAAASSPEPKGGDDTLLSQAMNLLGEEAVATFREHRPELLWAGLFFEAGRPEASRKKSQSLWLGEKMMSPAYSIWMEAARRLSMSNQRRDIVADRLRRAQEWQNFGELRTWRKRELLGDPFALLDVALLSAYSEVYGTSPAPLHAAIALLERLAEKGEPPLPPPLVDGRDLMQELGLAPGPHLGELLAQIRRAQLDEKISTREEAFGLANQPT